MTNDQKEHKRHILRLPPNKEKQKDIWENILGTDKTKVNI